MEPGAPGGAHVRDPKPPSRARLPLPPPNKSPPHTECGLPRKCRMNRMIMCLVDMACISILVPTTTARAEAGDEIMLQGFHWNANQGDGWYNTLATAANDTADAAFDIVWFPPPSKSADAVGYLPNEWYILNSRYGNQSALQGAIGALHNRGVFCIADIVVNHRVGTFGWADFSNPSFGNNNAAVVRNDEYCCGSGNWDTGESYEAARDLDHTNATVRYEIKQWQNWLMSVGFDGWRYELV